jgi:hypothetical protein
MSYPLQVYLTQLFQANAALIALLGQRSDGKPSVYPYHHRDVTNPTYPLITIARFGTRVNSNIFSDSMYATMMDAPKLAICSWSKNDVDEAVAVITVIRNIIRPTSFAPGNTYFAGYKLTEQSYRDDLFDETISAYHVHCEYSGWLQERFGNPQPVPSP